MKILYLGNDAESIAVALRGIQEGVTVLKGSHLDQAARALGKNPDIAALVVEAQLDGGDWRSVLAPLGALALRPGVVVVVPAGTGPLFESLEPGADGYIEKGDSLFRELPGAVARAVAHARGKDFHRGTTAASQAKPDLEQKLAHATAALQDAERRHQAAMAEATAQIAQRQAQNEIAVARASALWEMVDEQLRAAALQVEGARQGQASADAEADRLRHRDAELSSRLADAEAAAEVANVRMEQERAAAADHLAERQRELQAEIEEESANRRRVEDTLAHTQRTLEDAEKRHESAMSGAAAHSRELEQALRLTERDLESTLADVERLTKRELELSSTLADAATSREDLEHRLAAMEAAVRDGDADRLAASKKAAAREAELEGQIRAEREARTALEQALTDADAASRDAQQRHETALAAAASELAERQAHLDRELSGTVADRDRLAQQLSDIVATLDQARRDHHAAAADVERLTEREADLVSQLGAARAAHHTLEGQLADAVRAAADADERTARERAAATEREAKREDQFAGERLAHEGRLAAIEQRHHTLTLERDALQESLAASQEHSRRLDEDLHGVRGQLEQAHASADAFERARASADADNRRLTAKCLETERELSTTAADRDGLAQQLNDAVATLDQARRDHHAAAAGVERLTEREADLVSQLGAARAAHHTLEGQLADAMRAAADADERTARERAAATEREAKREDQFAEERLTHEGRLAAIEQRHHTLTLERDALQESLAASQEHSRRLDEDLHGVRGQLEQAHASADAFERARASADAEIRRLSAECFETERELQDARRHSRETLDRLSSEHATALAALAASVTERDTRLREQSRIQETLTRELEVTKRQVQDLQADLRNVQADLRNVQAEADEVPRLRTQVEASREESHRLFQQAGLAMFRCSRDGALIEANRACETLIGRRMIDELRGTQLAPAVFEAPDVLSWLIERCVSTTVKESTETTWRRQDGRRLFVRLSASLVASDLIEITAEDLTRVRVLQERLDKAHRMEAVGRLASEVAATCGNLLDDIRQHAQEGLMNAGADAASRQHGELLLDDASRAAGFLRQLSACGEEQARAPRLVDVNAVIRDLEPVLKRVAGNGIDVRVQETSSPLNVDVGMERVERLFVNLASYGRERMPFGGRLTIELATVVVDRQFAVKHPDVRLGLHALITVTETRRAARADGPPRHQATARSSHGSVEPRAGVDFRTLQQLVSECGGHLWVKVQPPGDMVVKIRLPLLSSAHDETSPDAHGAGVRALVRRFRQ